MTTLLKSMRPSSVVRAFGATTALVLVVAGCDLTELEEVVRPQVQLIAPARVLVGEPLPVVVEVPPKDDDVRNELDVTATGRFHLRGDGAELSAGVASIKRGRGSVTTRADAAGDFELTLDGVDGARSVRVLETLPVRQYAGRLPAGDQVWDATFDRVIDEDLVVPEGSELVIEAGTRVRLGPAANVIVRGTLRVVGTIDAPVVFVPATQGEAWGGVVVERGTAEVAYAFFTGGGSDVTRQFGHSNSQPVLYVQGGEATFERTFVLDNRGKAIGGRSARLSFERGLISRCDTGGEVHGSVIRITHSHILDIPNDDAEPVDDDNDGFYFAGLHDSGEASKVEHTFIITGKDDAIDHNQARLEVNHSWLEDFMHEGVAGSNGNWVRIYDTVVRGNEQGVEAGYGQPNVYVDHSVIVDNDVGLRFGDSYDWGSEGQMTVTNTIVYGNGDDVWNYDHRIEGPVDSAIALRYSMTDDPDYVDCPGCITGEPQFDEQYYLLPGSPGEGAGEDGVDLGRVRQP